MAWLGELINNQRVEGREEEEDEEGGMEMEADEREDMKRRGGSQKVRISFVSCRETVV